MPDNQHRKLYSKTISSIERCTYVAKAHTQNLLSLAKSASQLLLMRSSLMPLHAVLSI